MWPFKSKAARPAAVHPLPPVYGDHGFGGDPWLWGSLTSAAVDPKAAEAVAATGAAIGAISTTLAALPFAVVSASEQREESDTHDIARLIRSGANPNEDWPSFIETLVSTTLLRGNAAASIDTDSRGRIVSLTSLPWPQITVKLTDANDMLFDFVPTSPASARRTFAREDVLLLKDRSDNGLLGVPRLQRAAAAMFYAISIQSTAQSFSANLARPGGLLSTDQHISPELATRHKQEWDLAYNTRDGKGRTAILSGGMKWQALVAMTGEDAQLNEARRFSVEDIGRIFGVPTWLLGDPSRATFASSREAMRAFGMLTLMPWARRIEAAFQASVLGAEYRLKIDVASLAKSDTDALYASLQRARMAGILSANEARSELGWPASSDPTADLLSPPPMGGAQPLGESEPKPSEDEPPPAKSNGHAAH